MLLVTGVVGLVTLCIVVVLSAQTSSRHLQAVQHHIEEGIRNKGLVLTENHALALKGLALDNAFLDMQRLVDRAVRDDADLIYGIYVNSDREAIAFSQRGDAAFKEKTVEKNAWNSIGILPSELIVDRPTVTKVNRLGQELLEVSVPVTGDDHEPLGTIRYGLSTSRMHDALAKAKAESAKQLVRSVISIGIVILVATLLGLLLSRIQAVRITRPVGELTAAAETLASGDRSVKVNIDSKDELGLLGRSFNRMVADLDASYSELENVNRNLEDKVRERTAELGQKNRDMRLVLDNVDQGFITLTKTGVMAIERSLVVDEWFGNSDGPVPFWEYIGKSSRSLGLEFRLAWEQLVEDVLPLELCLEQLPRQCCVRQQTFNLRYLPFMKEGQFDGVLLVIADISERLAKERDDAEQSELMQGFKRLMLDRSGFASFLTEASEAVQEICGHQLDSDIPHLKRTLHTLKGNAALMGLVVVARICHAIEEQLADGEPRAAADTLEELQARWNAITEHIRSFAGNQQRVIEIPQSEYAAILSRLSQTDAQTELFNELLSWQLEPVSKPLERLGEQAKALARRFGKGEIDVQVQSNGLRLDPDTWHPFYSELVHLVRNAIDHGLETAEERLAQSKPVAGTLTLKSEATANTLVFEIGDDGRGVDWVRIAQKAAQLGLQHSTSAELLIALLHDGLSTRENASDISGRGVGMAALKQRIDFMGGELDVRTVKGSGTRWLITFPWSPLQVPTVRMRRASSMPPRRESIKLGLSRT